ncbi:SDR family NAD(P)-dependent oxidoreductase [Spelaeicoccus albus]|uniref:NAD(P)-dependent dehydrogenase (Short-subunit alcohol dehydrogenase family) n=1 Tax=Spelaeicoccus albus TaxID=1280376 RepID=A0A7Z0AA63_9MICO|nr:SDR family oxidoreductase [Spelaeicoccus albus]NYI67244.1 NAD(P)-dependent dehydrogenase (short-subunit alcohol dehydrogenase family) [Spelaeicoccus albus]
MSTAAAFPAERTALVTGAASARGIGRVTAERLAGDGWAVAIADLDGSASKEVAAEISDTYGVKTFGVGMNVADVDQVNAGIDDIEANLPQLVAAVNIAGISNPTPYLDITPAEWDLVMAVNLRGPHFVTQRSARSMVKNGVGRIVNISSCSAPMGGGTYSKTAYSTAKAGIEGLTRATARELSPMGITVNAVAPGPIDTDIMGGTLSDERKVELAAGLLVGRVGTQADIASMINYLVKEETSFITGQTYDVNGGLQFR